jgi:hypothetical protein
MADGEDNVLAGFNQQMIKRYIWFVALLWIACPAFPQQEASLSKPELELSDKQLIIGYDILGSDASDIFLISIELLDSEGSPLNATTLSGDIGRVNGGRNKKIYWDMEKDDIRIDDRISVEVLAEQVTMEKPATEPGEDITTRPPARSISKRGMVISSALLPGLGQCRATGGKPYWIMGIASYGFLAGSIYYDLKSESTYDDYLAATTTSTRDELYNDARNEKKVSRIFGLYTLGIWAGNMVWVILQSPPSNDMAIMVNKQGFSIDSSFDPITKVPLFTLKYTF